MIQPASRCRTCRISMVPAGAPVPEGMRRHEGRGLCGRCYKRDRRGLAPTTAASIQVTPVLEQPADNAWLAAAACASLDTRTADDLFYGSGDYGEAVRTLCDNCPVIDQCQAWGDVVEAGHNTPGTNLHGFLAGESAAERVARRRRASQSQDAA